MEKAASDPDPGSNIRDPLDIPFTADEVTKAVLRLKLRKAAGPDGLVGEHLRAALTASSFGC